jgi:glycosyltransferase involved in cell wall biosynthesis
VKSDLLNNGITKKPMRVLGHGNVRGVDMEYWSRRKEVMDIVTQKALKSQIFTFLFVGRIVHNKGIDELCQAFDKLSGITPVRLLLVGPYEDRLDPISQRSRDIIEKNPNIETVGAKSGDELLAYYAASDCFVFPSYREGFPNTVLEAGAMGLPSIVTDINGSREIIIQGQNGVIIPSRDVNALFQAMLDMMRDKTTRDRVASNARQLIASRYEQSYVRQCLYDFYDEILG